MVHIETREGYQSDPSPLSTEELMFPLGGAAEFMVTLPPHILQMIQDIIDDWLIEERIAEQKQMEIYPQWLQQMY